MLAAAAHRVPLVLKLVNDPAYERAVRLGLFAGTLEEFQAPRSPAAAWRCSRRRADAVVERAERIIIPSHYLAEIALRLGRVARSGCGVVPNPAPSVDGTASPGRAARPARLWVPDLRVRRATHAAEEPPARGLRAEPGRGRLARDRRRGSVRAELVLRPSMRPACAIGSRSTGALPRAEAIECMRAADASILPSDWENFPHAAVEALAAETPVIATAVGGVPEIVQSGVNGILVPPRDPDALAAAMAGVSEDDELRANLRAGALRASERYRKDVVYGTIEAELGRAVASKNGAPGLVDRA